MNSPSALRVDSILAAGAFFTGRLDLCEAKKPDDALFDRRSVYQTKNKTQLTFVLEKSLIKKQSNSDVKKRARQRVVAESTVPI